MTRKSIFFAKVFYTQKYFTRKSILHAKVFFSQKYFTRKSILHAKVFYSQKYFTRKSILLAKVFYSLKYFTRKSILLAKFNGQKLESINQPESALISHSALHSVKINNASPYKSLLGVYTYLN